MTKTEWVISNCKFANPENPYGWQGKPGLQRTMDFDEIENSRDDPNTEMFLDSFQSFKVIKEESTSEHDTIEEDRFDPGSQYGHYTVTVGRVEYVTGELLIQGKVYMPDELLRASAAKATPSMLVIDSLKEGDPPACIDDWVRNENLEELEIAYSPFSENRTGDWYDIVLKAEVNGERRD